MPLDFPDRYDYAFTPAQRAEHQSRHDAVSRDRPFELIGDHDGATAAITVLTFDFPGVFSLLTGTLGAGGFDILAGNAFTSRRGDGDRQRPVRRAHAARPRPTSPAPLPARRIVDRFEGSLPAGAEWESWWHQLESRIAEVLALLTAGDADSVTQARRVVNEWVASRLADQQVATEAVMYPMSVTFDPSARPYTRIHIVGQDTPFFLYALSSGISLQGIQIQGVEIHTQLEYVQDIVDVVDRTGKPIAEQSRQDQLRLVVLLTKQFTYFLDRAPDPYAALVRFETLTQEVVGRATNEGLTPMLSDPLVLKDLARLLGTSDFLWEDFIRAQYETLIPMLRGSTEELTTDKHALQKELAAQMRTAASDQERRAVLNHFKDTHIFRIDVEHIVAQEVDFFFLSRHLSDLAEVVVDAALRIVWPEMTTHYGTPRTVAGLQARYAVFGLGKLGGRALGYASDIELLFVYGDNGQTDGAQSISNAEFFERFFSEVVSCIESKREGIFQVDVRLRPYGTAGPLAVSLESFCRHYARDGDAHSYEKLALTRLRYVAGDPTLGQRVERLRDDLIYFTDSVDARELRELRQKQLHEKHIAGKLNAKFSPGGLVDLEYSLQILMVRHGRSHASLRTPSLHATLNGLARAGIVEHAEADRLVKAYRFLRNLINGLRMLRGNAQDLYLPEVSSLEYQHLARRTGYEPRGELSAAEQLHIEFDSRTAAVRAFVERHLGRDSIPGTAVGNSADLVLAHAPPPELVETVARSAGLRDGSRALTNLRSLSGTAELREIFSRLVVLAWESLRKVSDPDMSLNNWDRFALAVGDRGAHFAELFNQPRKLDLMLQVFATSQFLADLLIMNPEFLDWALNPAVVKNRRTRDEMLGDLRERLALCAGSAERMAALRRFRKREMLRIATRDVCLGHPLPEITAELSWLAEAILQASLESNWADLGGEPEALDRFCVLAFGKLGGRELNYSSDIDLIGIFDPRDFRTDAQAFEPLLERLRSELSDHTPDGTVYRVDLRLRPFGTAGPLASSLAGIVRYYTADAAPWEWQALLKLRPVAGALPLGRRFLDAVRPGFISRWTPREIAGSVRELRRAAVRESERRGRTDDVKSGMGGIRDIEFAVQALQMAGAGGCDRLLNGNTLESIAVLSECGLIDPETAGELSSHYRYLRRLEHFLQVYEDRQVHRLPTTDAARTALAKRLSPDDDPEEFMEQLARRRDRVRSLYDRILATIRTDE